MDGMGGAGALANELIWLRTPRTGDCQVNCKREEGVLGVGGLDASALEGSMALAPEWILCAHCLTLLGPLCPLGTPLAMSSSEGDANSRWL